MQGLPVLAHGASTHARGLIVRPRQVPLYLAFIGAADIAFGPGNGLGTWEFHSISRLITRPAWSSRTMARTGLRMMPTFPSSPLRFRTAGFPQYGSTAGLSDGGLPPRVP